MSYTGYQWQMSSLLVRWYGRRYEDPTKTGILASRLSRSLKIIRSDTDRSATYDFSLTFHSSHGLVLYHFHDSEILAENVNCSPSHSYLMPRRGGFHLVLDNKDELKI